MSFEDWQKQNKELTGFESWQQENKQRGLAGEAGAAVVRTFLNEAKGLIGTYGSAVKAGIAAPLPALIEKLRPGTLSKPIEQATTNIRSAEQKFQPTREDKAGWVVNTLAGGGTQLGINLVAGQKLGWIGPAVNMFSVARQNTLDAGGSELEADLTGLSEAALESWGVSRLLKFKEAGKGSFKALINNVRKGLMKQAAGDLKNIGANTLKSALVEGLEEVSQGGAEFLWETIPGGRDIPRKPDGSVDWWNIVGSLAEQGAGGALVGGVIPVGAGGVEAGVETTVEGRKRPQIPISEQEQAPERPVETRTQVDEGKTTPEAEIVAEKQPVQEQPTQKQVEQEKLTEAAIRLKSGEILTGTTHANILRGVQKSGRTISNEEFDIPADTGFITDKGNFVSPQEGWDIAEKAGQLKLEGEDAMAQEFIDRKHLIAEGVEFAKPEQPKQKPPRMSRRKLLKLGHDLPKALGWNDAQRRDFMQQAVGKTSMKGMKPKEMRILVEALQGKMKEVGLEYTPPELPIEKLVNTLQQTKRITETPQKEKLNRGTLSKMVYNIKRGVYTFGTGLERMERFFESLDGHKKGEFTKTFWEPVKQADELTIENTNNDQKEFMGFLSGEEIDPAIWLGKTSKIPDTKLELTKFQKIGVYSHAQNKSGRAALKRNAGFTEEEISAVEKSMLPEEMKVYNWLKEQYDNQWKPLVVAATQAGIDPATLKQEFRYTPLIYLDKNLNEQDDMLSDLAKPFTQEQVTPEKRFLEKRTKVGGLGGIELDAAVLYLHNINRINRFMQMAPVAKKLTGIINNRTFRQELNSRTYAQGVRLIKAWAKDSVRGYVSDNTSYLSKTIATMRRNGVVYAIGYNIPSSLRQTLSLSNAVAVDPAMLKYIPANMAKAAIPSNYKKLKEFVYNRSLLAKTRSYDRDLQQKYNQSNLKKSLSGKAPWSRKAISWIRWMDRHTVTVAWKSLYDVGMEKFNVESKAIEFADKWVTRTQPMANTKNLPDFFRGGTLEKLLTTFQNQINNNGNFYAYDIIGAKKLGEINLTQVGYRTMFSYVLPAILYGMIGRARLPKDIKELLTDLATYPIASLVVVGRWIERMIRGWDNSGTIAEIAPTEASKLGRAIKRGDLSEIIKRAATTIGALTGHIPAQAIRTTEGAIDIAAGTTKDPRRLIYSEWALNQGKKKKKKRTRKGGGGYAL